MKLFAATFIASAFCETNIENKIARFRRDAGYETIPFLDKEAKAWPESHNVEYRQNGKIITIDDLDMYVVGEGNKNAIIWNYDVFGFDSGRTREYCDHFADNGFLVVLPDFFRGEGLTVADFFPAPDFAALAGFTAKHTNWINIQNDIDNKILPYLNDQDITTFGSMGTCWGGYNSVRMASYAESEYSVIFHTSHVGLIEGNPNEDETSIYEDVKHDILLLNSAGEPESVRADGLMNQILGDKFQSVDYTQDHGWVTRGNISIPEVKADVDDAIQRALEFANDYKYDYSSASILAQSLISLIICINL